MPSAFSVPAGTPVGQIDPFTGLLVNNRRTVNVPGYTPDFNALLQGDPLLGQFKADLSAQDISDLARAQSGIQRGLIQFGEIPDNLGLPNELTGAIDSTTRGLASQNTAQGLSAIARLTRANQRQQANIADRLTGMGALRSGQYGYELGNQAQDFKQQQFDTRQQLMDYIQGFSEGLAQQRKDRQRSLADEYNSAMARQMQLPTGQARPEYSYDEVEYGLPPAPPAPPPIDWASLLGQMGGGGGGGQAPAPAPAAPPPAPAGTGNPVMDYAIQMGYDPALVRRLSARQRQQLIDTGTYT